ncbi:hypothetical protein GQ600_27820 [Phytophthora cactorum]|nr:hypothetical protein GQ600_27820 [Phytophthora cactorum]
MELAIRSGVSVSDSPDVVSLENTVASDFHVLIGGLEGSPAGFSGGNIFVRSSAVFLHVDRVIRQSPSKSLMQWYRRLAARKLSRKFQLFRLACLICGVAGPLPRDYVDHFMHYWDGRFVRSVTFTTKLFDQMQRYSAVQKAARVGVTHGKTIEKFGQIINTSRFKQAFANAKSNPDSKEDFWLNARLFRLLSLVGGLVQCDIDTGSRYTGYNRPPEYGDLLLHRIAVLQDRGCGMIRIAFTCIRGVGLKFAANIRYDARARLAVSAQYPALSAQVFERR